MKMNYRIHVECDNETCYYLLQRENNEDEWETLTRFRMYSHHYIYEFELAKQEYYDAKSKILKAYNIIKNINLY